MPLYEYQCTKCSKVHEIIQKFSDAPLAACPECGGDVKKLISNTSFVLKGTGWYVTDYASPARKEAEDSGKPAGTTTAPEPKKDAAAETKVSEPAKQEAPSST
jgi:putative FmdB family regulatory protein